MWWTSVFSYSMIHENTEEEIEETKQELERLEKILEDKKKRKNIENK